MEIMTIKYDNGRLKNNAKQNAVALSSFSVKYKLLRHVFVELLSNLMLVFKPRRL